MTPLVAAASAALAVLVTHRLRADAFWGREIGRLGLEYRNLPVGGVVALGVALLTSGDERTSALTAGAVMATVAVVWRWVDPPVLRRF